MDNSTFYFETSAVNYLSGTMSTDDAMATKAYQKLKGNKWYISPVTIWEILITSDEYKKESLIFFSQHLFNERLLMAPSEIIVNFIRNGCPLVEEKYDIHSNLILSKVWTDICEDTKKTFVFEQDLLMKQVNIIRETSKFLERLLKTNDLDVSKVSEFIPAQTTIEGILNNLTIIKQNRDLIDDEMRQLYRIAIFFIMFILCAEMDLSPEPIQEFWRQVGLDSVLDRIQYIFSNYEILVHRGPFAEMALMAQSQFKYKSSRGLLFDCLHSLYLPYINHFFTTDEHFRYLRSSVIHFNYLKILLMDEIEITLH